MEIHFQNNQKPKLPRKNRPRKNNSSNSNKFIGVRQRPSGRWVAEIKDTTQKIRMWLGTFETAEEAARAYDEAACLLRGSHTRTNFATQVSPNSPLASRIRRLLNNKKTGPTKSQDQESQSQSQSQSQESTPSSQSSSPSTSTSLDAECTTSPSTSGEFSQLCDDVYKPDLSGFTGEPGPITWGPDHGPDRFFFAQEMLDMPKNLEMELSEFERYKVERQISASLYAINGVHEYMETVYDPIEALWDLPPLSPLLS